MSEQHRYALWRLMAGFLRLGAIQEHVGTRVYVSYLSTCSDMLLLVCATHTSLQSFDPSDQRLPLMRCSFDTKVSISIGNGLSVGLVQLLAALVLVITRIYLENAAKLAAIYRHLGLPRST